MTYEYLATGEMRVIRENGGAVLASFGYDDLGRRTSLDRGNGTSTSYGYDAGSWLTGMGLHLAGNASVDYGYGYNPAGQITTRTASNDAYAWTGAVNVDRGYQVNALNQYTQAGPVALGYDGRGNLSSSGGSAFKRPARPLLRVNCTRPPARNSCCTSTRASAASIHVNAHNHFSLELTSLIAKPTRIDASLRGRSGRTWRARLPCSKSEMHRVETSPR